MACSGLQRLATACGGLQRLAAACGGLRLFLDLGIFEGNVYTSKLFIVDYYVCYEDGYNKHIHAIKITLFGNCHNTAAPIIATHCQAPKEPFKSLWVQLSYSYKALSDKTSHNSIR